MPMTVMPKTRRPCCGLAVTLAVYGLLCASAHRGKPRAHAEEKTPAAAVQSGWSQLGRTSARNHVTVTAKNLPENWDVKTGLNVKWQAEVGSTAYSGVVMTDGSAGKDAPKWQRRKLLVGTNNAGGYIKRYPWNRDIQNDLGVLLCFAAEDGEFLWQYSSEKLATGRMHDWPMQGIVSTPLVVGDRCWFVSNRCEVVCLDVNGFRDGRNDGPVTDEVVADNEADVIWRFDMLKSLDVWPHTMSTCSPTTDGKHLFVITANGVDDSDINIPKPDAPSFVCLDRATGKVVWTDNSPGKNILDGQWSSPAFGVFNGQPQVLFPGGDGWLYSFTPTWLIDWRNC